ncbi:NUDIX domain-containing protein [Micromonospora sp. NPDC006766]|uniref:NUDIX hydrolase n=1 Tax=Micromonospora sp. NPDC006766 TaxID=3154778 RepID=UPI00340E72A2
MGPEDRLRDPNLAAIQKVGAAIVRDGKIMVVRKKDQPSPEYFMPGGRMEEGETQRETLFREIREELCVDIDCFEYIGSFEDRAVFEGTPIIIHAYLVTVIGEPTAASEVKEYKWIDQHHERQGLAVSSIMGKQVIPALVKAGRL